MSLGAKIESFCENNFSSKAEFARALGINRERLYPIFKNKVVPGADFIKKLYDLGCPLDWLFSDSTNQKAAEPVVPYRTKLLHEELTEAKEEIRQLLKRIEKLEKLTS